MATAFADVGSLSQAQKFGGLHGVDHRPAGRKQIRSLEFFDGAGP